MPNPNALLTLPEAKAYLRTGDSEDQAVLAAIDRASEYADTHVGRQLVKRTYTNLRLAGECSCKLYLPGAPIVTGTLGAIYVNEVVQTTWKQESDGDPGNFTVVVAADDPRRGPNHLWRADGWAPTSARNRYNVRLASVELGYEPLPEDLKEAAYLLVQKFYRDQVRQLTDVQTVQTPDGQQTVFDVFIPRRARDILDTYAKRSVA
jgi:hypothetical protein